MLLHKKIIVSVIGLLLLNYGIAQTPVVNNESAVALPKMTESQILANYSGVNGTAPRGYAISSAGVAVEQWPNAAQTYLYFSQNLKNDVYYEVRAYGRYNYKTMNPVFSSVPVSNISNPPGYGFTGIFGYNFHPSEFMDITPYVRFNYLNNMNVVYEDSNGNFINSVGWTAFIGSKFTFKVSKVFTPFFNYYAGYQQVNLSGNLTESTKPNQVLTAQVEQLLSIFEVGAAFKASQSMSIIPYFDYVTSANNPDATAAAPYSQGGFNISPLTSTFQIVGVKLNYAW